MSNSHLTQADAEEELPLADREGRIIGHAPRSACHSSNTMIHPVVHVHVINSKGEIYLQKRSMRKLIQPGKWDTSVGGHITYGESLEEALRRESWEEAGIEDGRFEKIAAYLWECKRETEFINVFKCQYENPKVIAVAEIDEGRFWTRAEIEAAIGQGVLTPNFEAEYQRIVHLL